MADHTTSMTLPNCQTAPDGHSGSFTLTVEEARRHGYIGADKNPASGYVTVEWHHASSAPGGADSMRSETGYLTTCTEAQMIDEIGPCYTWAPWGGDTREYKGGSVPVTVNVPEGAWLAETVGGELLLFVPGEVLGLSLQAALAVGYATIVVDEGAPGTCRSCGDPVPTVAPEELTRDGWVRAVAFDCHGPVLGDGPGSYYLCAYCAAAEQCTDDLPEDLPEDDD